MKNMNIYLIMANTTKGKELLMKSSDMLKYEKRTK